jgi:hypothetical protein
MTGDTSFSKQQFINALIVIVSSLSLTSCSSKPGLYNRRCLGNESSRIFSLQRFVYYLFLKRHQLRVKHGYWRQTTWAVRPKTDVVIAPNGSLKDSASCLKLHTVSEPLEGMLPATHILCTIATLFTLLLKGQAGTLFVLWPVFCNVSFPVRV